MKADWFTIIKKSASNGQKMKMKAQMFLCVCRGRSLAHLLRLIVSRDQRKGVVNTMTLQLTPQQQNILDGNEGPARKLAMEILVKVGEGFGAQRLIPIQSVHLVLHAYKSAFDAGVEAAERIADMVAGSPSRLP